MTAANAYPGYRAARMRWLPRSHPQCAILFGHLVGIEELLSFQYRLLGRLQHGVKPPQHGERQNDVAVLAAHVHVAQAVIGDIPDEVGNPLQLALILLFVGFH